MGRRGQDDHCRLGNFLMGQLGGMGRHQRHTVQACQRMAGQDKRSVSDTEGLRRARAV